MLNKSIARRYAEAFFAIAQDSQKIDQYQNELTLVVDTVAASAELKTYMAHVLIPPVEKKNILTKLFADKVSEVTLNFLKVIVDKRRASYFEAIQQEFVAMADESRGILKADLYSAKPVSDQEIAELEKSFSAATGKSVKLNLTIDPSLLGGIKVRVGDRVIDASVVKKLDMLKANLKKAKIS